MDTGKQVNAMVVILLLTVVAVGFYALFDPFRADKAESDQLEMTAERGAHTFALNCRLCHGDAGEGGVMGGRLPAAPALDRPDLRGFEDGIFSVPSFDEDFVMIMNTISCGRAGTFMPTWGRIHGGTLSEEQIRQLAVIITGANPGADPRNTNPDAPEDSDPPPIGYWEETQHAADEIDAETTGHATLEMPDGSLNDSATELTVSNAARYSVEQFIRIDGERMEITDVPTTGQQLVQDVGKEPDEIYVSGADGIAIGDIIRVDGELLEVTGIREDGQLEIALDASLTSSADVISVDNPAFFTGVYTVHAASEQIEVVGPVETGQLLAIATGRAETTISVTGTEGIEIGSQIRMGEELLEVLEMVSAVVTVERGAADLDGDASTASTHTAGTSIFKVVEELSEEELADGFEPEDPDTGQSLLETVGVDAPFILVTGTSGLSVGQTYQVGDELMLVTGTQPAILRVARGVGDTDAAVHARRVSIFDGNFLNVERGVLGTSASSHDAGTELLFDVLQVERAAQGSTVEDHSKNAEVFLGNILIVERGVLNTEPADHENGTLVLDFPPPPDAPSVTGATCGQNPPLVSDTPDGPVATPREDAEQVGVTLSEFTVVVDPTAATGEPIDFTVANDGAGVHNFRVVATDLAPDALPLDGSAVDESQFDEVGGFSSALQPGSEQVVNADLTPGSYVLFCNVPTHYGLGMFTGFEVTAP